MPTLWLWCIGSGVVRGLQYLQSYGLSYSAACGILVSRSGNLTCVPCTARQILHPRTSREVLDQAFLINALAFMICDEAASHASVTHLLWLKERASKMCSSALVRTGVNQETECVYVKWLTFNVCRIRGKKSSLILV